MDVLISIVLPVYNRYPMLLEAIQTVVAQTYPHWELIIVDDGSTDQTAEFSSKGNKTYESFEIPKSSKKRIRIHRIPNSGVSRARNLGIQDAQGEWICFLDSDDLWYPQKLERQIKFSVNVKSFRYGQTLEVWNKKGNRLLPQYKFRKPNILQLESSLDSCLVTVSSFFGHRESLVKLGGFREELPSCEDYDLWNRILLTGDTVYCLDEILLERRGGHEDQLSAKYIAMERFRLYSLLQTQSEWKEQGIWEDKGTQEKEYWNQAIAKRFQVLVNGRKKRNLDINNLIDLHARWIEGRGLASEHRFLLDDRYFA